MRVLNFTGRRQKLITGPDGCRVWVPEEKELNWKPEETAVLLSDMWDKHWCSGATLRVSRLAKRMNEAVARARSSGMLIVHAPSDTTDFYEGTAARERFLKVRPPVGIELVRDIENYPLPIDDKDGGSDTADKHPVNFKAWSRQIETIFIDQEKDVICGDEGDRLYAYFKEHNISHILVMGVHTNMCVLNRSFGIKQLLRYGFDAALVRDLTDAMYNPAMPPYVSHEKGTELIVEYIEKFYCPTIDSGQI